MSAYAELAPVPFSPGGRIAAAVRGVKRATPDASPLRVVLYACGSRDERAAALARCQEWSAVEGYQIIATREDDQVEYPAARRSEVVEALGFLSAGRADAVVLPHENFAALTDTDRQWFRASAECFGGRVETVPRSSAELAS
jgi:hypothetical protein